MWMAAMYTSIARWPMPDPQVFLVNECGKKRVEGNSNAKNYPYSCFVNLNELAGPL